MKKLNIVLISLLSAFIIMSSGYGIWQKDLIIEGDLEVVADPNVIKALESDIQSLKTTLQGLESALEEKLEEQRIQEELRVLEELKLIEEQKLLEEELKEQERIDKVADDKEFVEVYKVNNNETIDPNISPVGDTETNTDEVTDVEDNNEVTYTPDNYTDN